MDEQDNPIEGFVRRPKPKLIIYPEVIVISDEDSGEEPSVPRTTNLESVVKREGSENETTTSEISVPSDVIDDEKKKRKKKKKYKTTKWKKSEKSERKFKKEIISEESSNSDSDSSSDAHKRHKKHRSEKSSSSSNSSSSSDSSVSSSEDSDSSDYGSRHKKRRKKTHYRSKKSKNGGKKKRSSSKRKRKTKKSRNSKRLRCEEFSRNSFDPSMSSYNGQNNSNQVPNVDSRVRDVEVGASIQNYLLDSSSQYDSAMYGIPTQILTTTTANDNGHGTHTLYRTVPLERCVDDGEVTGTSLQSPASADTDKIMRFVADIQDNTTQITARDIGESVVENPNENQSIPDFPPIVHGSELANDQNDLLQLISLNDSDTEHRDEQLPDLNVERSGGRQLPAINLQRPRPNTDKMLYLTNPERANVCVFCYDSFTNIVNHYRKKHSTEEVYVSRISPKMANRFRKDDFKRFEAKCEKKGSFWKLHAKCFFCEYPRTFNLSYWLDHIRVHTGEYARLCVSCGANVIAHGHCGFASELLRTPHNLASDDLMCFMCKCCNFVQIELKNMLSHLTKQHGFQDNELGSKYDVRMLLPSKITVCRERAPAITQGAKGIGAINQQENARNIRVLHEILLSPFNNGAAESNTPEPNTSEPNTTEPQIEAKREIGWEQRLEAIYPNYITDEDNEIVVNPWHKTPTFKTNIFSANLFDFYKCMHPNCIFSTNEKMALKHHINDHYSHSDIGFRKRVPIDIHNKCRSCPYCYLGPFKSVNDLWDHMENIHSACTYQCSHCYYRCIEMDSIVLHYEKFHPNEEKNIYVVNSERKFGGEQKERMSDGECAKISQFHEFECSYCSEFESSQVDEMRIHLAEHHSSEFMFVLRRGEKDENIYIGAMSQWKNFKFFRCGKYRPMSKYLDWDEKNRSDQPNPFPLVPVLRTDFEFEPSKLQIAEDVIESKFVYREYADYKKSQTLLFRCGRFTAEYLMKNPHEQGSLCRICGNYIEKDNSLHHLEEHKKTDCYFTAECEHLILQHMERKHSKISKETSQQPFYYRKCERKIDSWNESSIKCLFACGICSNQTFLCLELARKHHKVSHPNDVETIQIERSLDDRRITNETFSFKAYRYCAEPTVDGHVRKPECSVPMTVETLKQHHAKYHANDERRKYKKETVFCKNKLVLCKNNEIFPKL